MKNKARDRVLFSAMTFLIIAMTIVQYQGGGLSDKNWLLLAARMWLEGKRLYVDIIEVNPPLIICLYAVPVFLSKNIGMEDYHVLVIIMLLLTVISVVTCLALIKFHTEFKRNIRYQIGFVLLLFIAFILWANPAYFADREHIFIVLVFPYLFRWMPSLSTQPIPKTLRVAVGVLAGLGFCIKPHCLIIFGAVQLLTLLRDRSLAIIISIENRIIYAAGIMYLVVAWIAFSDYFDTVLPMALVTYGAYNNGISSILLYLSPLITCAVAFADFRLRYKTPFRADIYYWLAIVLAMLLYAVVNNGWLYSVYPLHVAVLVCVAAVWREFVWLRAQAIAQDEPTRQFVYGARACLIVFLLNLASVLPYGATFFISSPLEHTSEDQCVMEMKKIIKDNNFQSFGAISLSANVWPRLTRETGVRFETRFHNMWMLPKFLQSTSVFQEEKAWILRYVANGLVDDLKQRRPDIMFVETATKKYKRLELERYFLRYPDFSDAWNNYSAINILGSQENKSENEGNKRRGTECNYTAYKRIR